MRITVERSGEWSRGSCLLKRMCLSGPHLPEDEHRRFKSLAKLKLNREVGDKIVRKRWNVWDTRDDIGIAMAPKKPPPPPPEPEKPLEPEAPPEPELPDGVYKKELSEEQLKGFYDSAYKSPEEMNMLVLTPSSQIVPRASTVTPSKPWTQWFSFTILAVKIISSRTKFKMSVSSCARICAE